MLSWRKAASICAMMAMIHDPISNSQPNDVTTCEERTLSYEFTVVGSFSTSAIFQVTFNSNGCVYDPTDADRYCAPAETRITDFNA